LGNYDLIYEWYGKIGQGYTLQSILYFWESNRISALFSNFWAVNMLAQIFKNNPEPAAGVGPSSVSIGP
jgi:hypothetical protein